MKSAAVARRYAKALFDLAKAAGAIDEQEQQLQIVLDAMAASPELRAVIDHQLIHPRAKKDLVGKFFAGRLNPVTLNFLNLLIDKHRESMIDLIAETYKVLADEARGFSEVEVRSAVPLEAGTLGSLEARLSSKLQKKIKVRTSVDESLIGGLVVRAGDLLMDGSVKTRLARLREAMVGRQQG